MPPESRAYGGGTGGSGELLGQPGGAMERKEMGKWEGELRATYRRGEGKESGL